MLESDIVSAFLFLSGALVSVAVAAFVFRKRDLGKSTDNRGNSRACDDEQVFHLRGRELIQANFAGRRQLNLIGDAPDDFSRLGRLVSAHFDGSEALLASANEKGDLSAASRDDRFQIVREVAGDEVRLEVASRQTDTMNPRDLHTLNAAADELKTLREMAHHTPFHLWRENAGGEVIWANKNYLDEVVRSLGSQDASVWPIPALFPGLQASKHTDTNMLRRIRSHPSKGDDDGWYDCHVVDIDGDRLCTAFRADEAVRSEARRREFTQTLTKTFADLAIGLAIFDRSRRLALFNPALTDLTSLPVDPAKPGWIPRSIAGTPRDAGTPRLQGMAQVHFRDRNLCEERHLLRYMVAAGWPDIQDRRTSASRRRHGLSSRGHHRRDVADAPVPCPA